MNVQIERHEPLKPVWYKRPKATKPQGSASNTIITDFIRYTQGQKTDFAKATPVRETSLYTACGTKRREERRDQAASQQELPPVVTSGLVALPIHWGPSHGLSHATALTCGLSK